MNRATCLKLAVSSLIFPAVLSGCSTFGGGGISAASQKPAVAKDAPKYAAKAQSALAKGSVEDAIAYAERSVEAFGSDPETRALLGHAYLSAGRFASAERSFDDALELGKNDARTVLSLAMAQLGQGKAGEARSLIDQHRAYLPTADYGLALAISGDAKAAVSVLETAIRSANVTGRTRQNLGLAYALDGRWKEAKLMAVQDMTPATVDARIMQWAQMARPEAYQVRVASLLDVTPMTNDPGQPVRLALVPAPLPEEVQVASVVPSDSFDTVPAIDDAPLPAIGPAPVPAEGDVTVAPVALPPSSVVGPAARPSAATKPPAGSQVAAAPRVTQVASTSPVVPRVSGSAKPSGHIVQLGAFSSREGAARAWKIYSQGNPELAAFDYATAPVKVRGKTLHRLAVIGFGSENAANGLCGGIKSRGGSCIVRYLKGFDSPAAVRMAKATGNGKLAAR